MRISYILINEYKTYLFINEVNIYGKLSSYSYSSSYDSVVF